MVVENYEKVFTDDGSNNIIKKDYNPLNKEQYRNYEREGLFMEETKDIELDGIINELSWKGKIIFRIFRKDFIKVYNKVRIDIVNVMLK